MKKKSSGNRSGDAAVYESEMKIRSASLHVTAVCGKGTWLTIFQLAAAWEIESRVTVPSNLKSHVREAGSLGRLPRTLVYVNALRAELLILTRLWRRISVAALMDFGRPALELNHFRKFTTLVATAARWSASGQPVFARARGSADRRDWRDHLAVDHPAVAHRRQYGGVHLAVRHRVPQRHSVDLPTTCTWCGMQAKASRRK